jgi:cellulose synthase/poly-beta-1,6-N-acetylglucosamine synthase-like glycosyltransferase
LNLLSTLVALLAIPLLLLLLLPGLSEIVSIVWQAFHRPESTPSAEQPPVKVPRLAILVPAHNEELLIERCVGSLMAMTRTNVEFDVIVIADNCDDSTALRAGGAGARVLERQDPGSPGKPQALRWALDQIPLPAYDAVVIIDADSVVDPTYADALATHAPLREKAVQSYNGVANHATSWLSRLAGLLITVRYEGQFLQKRRAHLNCPLANGMLMGTSVLARYGWPAESLTENWEVYARFTVGGVPIAYAPDAHLGSQQAEGLSESSVQRSRWQAGRWQVLRNYAGPLLRSSAIGWRQKLDSLAELTSPGPVVHATLAIAASGVLLLSRSPLGNVLIGLFLASLLPLVSWTAWAIWRDENRGQLLLALTRLPFYAGWRFLVLLRSTVTARRAIWVRSPRHSAEVF